jgi:hypothetical protein
MAITRPELERQRPLLRLLPFRIQNSHWAGFAPYGVEAGVLSYDGNLMIYGDNQLVIGGSLELSEDSLPWRAYRAGYDLVKVVMKFGLGRPLTGVETFVLSSEPTADQGMLSIEDSSIWAFSAPRQPIPLGLGNHQWEIHATDTSGETHSCYVGELMVTP